MKFVVCAQDISNLQLGIQKDDGEWIEKIFFSRPEQYLENIVQFLKDHQIDILQITQLFVVNGFGSPTSLRISVTIVNTIAYLYKIPVFSGLKGKDQLLFDWFLQIQIQETGKNFAFVKYDRNAVIM